MAIWSSPRTAKSPVALIATLCLLISLVGGGSVRAQEDPKAAAAAAIEDVKARGGFNMPDQPNDIPALSKGSADVSDLIARGQNNGAGMTAAPSSNDPNSVAAISDFSEIASKPRPAAADIYDLTEGARNVTAKPEDYAAGVLVDQPSQCVTETKAITTKDYFDYFCTVESSTSGDADVKCQLPLVHLIGTAWQYMCVRTYERFSTAPGADCPRFEAYVNAHSDLVSSFASCNPRVLGSYCNSKCAYGRIHYSMHGLREGRVIPDGRWTETPSCSALRADSPNCWLAESSCASSAPAYEYACQAGFATVGGPDQTCTRTLRHVVDADFRYVCSRSKASSSAPWLGDTVCAAAVTNGCVEESSVCGSYETLRADQLCKVGNSVSNQSSTCFKVRVDTVDQDVMYTVQSNWNVASQSWVKTPAWSTVETAGCVKASEWSGPPSTYTRAWTCVSGETVTNRSQICNPAMVVSVDQDVAYTVRSDWNPVSKTWVASPAWNAVVGASCSKQLEWSGEPSTFTRPWLCVASEGVSIAAQSCQASREIIVDEDYRYQGLSTWNGSAHAPDASILAYQAASCNFEFKRCVTPSNPQPGTYRCSSGYKMNATQTAASCTESLNVVVGPVFSYKCTGRSVFNRIDSAWQIANCFDLLAQGCTRQTSTGSYGSGTYFCPDMVEKDPTFFEDLVPVIVDQGFAYVEKSASRDISMCSTYDATCTKTQDVCVEGPETRTVYGAVVYKDCWKWRKDFTCSTSSRQDATGCAPPNGASVRASWPRCGWADSNGQCQWYDYEYDVPSADNTGGCLTYTEYYRCENPISGVPAVVAGEGNPSLTYRDVVSDTYNFSACSTLSSNSACSVSSDTCVEGPQTRTVNGLSVYRDCWKLQRNYSCVVRTPVSYCGYTGDAGFVTGLLPSGCNQTGSRCLETFGGSCIRTETSYTCRADSGSGGSDIKYAKYRCADPVAAAEPPAGVAREILYTVDARWDDSMCSALAGDAACTVVSETCLEGAANRTINGYSVYQACWKKERNYSCSGRTSVSYCGFQSETGFQTQTLPTGCTQSGSRCLETVNGTCIRTETSYNCPANSGSGGSDIKYANFVCSNPVSAAEPPASIARQIIYNLSTTWDESSCSTQVGDPACRIVSEICSEEGSTKVINGLAVTAACWKYTRSYSCERLTAVNECPPAGGVNCGEKSSACIQNKADGSCALYQKTYTCDAGQGACLREDKSYLCERKLSTGTPKDTIISVETGVWDEGTCAGVNTGLCSVASTTCNQTSSEVVYGTWKDDAGSIPLTSVQLPLGSVCQSETRSFTCVARQAYDTCKVPAGCTQKSTSCIERGSDNTCLINELVYQCTPPTGDTACIREEQRWLCENPNPGAGPGVKVKYVKGKVWNDAQCVTELSKYPNQCTRAPTETCIEGAGTRVVEGLSIAEECWKKERTYVCHADIKGNDCNVPAGCTLDRTECLRADAEPTTGPCLTTNFVYKCVTEKTEYKEVQICSNDKFCIGGNCFEKVDEKSDDFGEAAAASGILNEVSDSVDPAFDPATLQIFKGSSLRCTKDLFGLKDCCPSSGGNAPGGLLSFLCSENERKLWDDLKAKKVHYVGGRCGNRSIFGCVRRDHVYCTFGSQLGRIIHQQGRPQISLGFGDAKTPVCRGFMIDEFERLDFDAMDLSEFMQDVLARTIVKDPSGVLANLSNSAQLFGAGSKSNQGDPGHSVGDDPAGGNTNPENGAPTSGDIIPRGGQ